MAQAPGALPKKGQKPEGSVATAVDGWVNRGTDDNDLPLFHGGNQ
jgi:hypothetical protein